MRAMRAEAFSGYKELKLVDLPKPAVTDGKVLVRMTAAGVTPLDYTILSGKFHGSKPASRPREAARTAEDQRRNSLSDKTHHAAPRVPKTQASEQPRRGRFGCVRCPPPLVLRCSSGRGPAGDIMFTRVAPLLFEVFTHGQPDLFNLEVKGSCKRCASTGAG
jgi:hypothetical protein